jgi:hypothetical protein
MIMGPFFNLEGNGDLVMNSVDWLAERTEQIALNRPEVKKMPISLQGDKVTRLRYFAFPLLPCLVGLLGIFVHTLGKKY